MGNFYTNFVVARSAPMPTSVKNSAFMNRIVLLTQILAMLCILSGCSKEQTAEGPIKPIRSDEEHNRRYNEAVKLISPYMKLQGASPKPADTEAAQRELRRGIRLLEAVTAYAPDNWSAHWITGKAFQALNEQQSACNAFKRAYEIQDQNADVAREYMHACLELGRTEEALVAAEKAVSVRPKDAGLHANLALACLLAGKNSDALKSIEEALRLNAADTISQNVKKVIQEVIDGKRPQPKKLSEIED
jgi:tetratricopeptide (TPR) repeat protein